MVFEPHYSWIPNLQTQLFAETDCNTEINTVVFLQVFVDIMQGRGIFVTEHMQSQSRSTGPYFTFFQLLCAKNKTKHNKNETKQNSVLLVY